MGKEKYANGWSENFLIKKMKFSKGNIVFITTFEKLRQQFEYSNVK